MDDFIKYVTRVRVQSLKKVPKNRHNSIGRKFTAWNRRKLNYHEHVSMRLGHVAIYCKVPCCTWYLHSNAIDGFLCNHLASKPRPARDIHTFIVILTSSALDTDLSPQNMCESNMYEKGYLVTKMHSTCFKRFIDLATIHCGL